MLFAHTSSAAAPVVAPLAPVYVFPTPPCAPAAKGRPFAAPGSARAAMLAFLAASLSVMAGPQRVFAHSAGGPDRPAAVPATGNLLVGTWALVSVDNRKPDGSHTQPYGADPRGLLIFDARGRYSLQIFRAQRPRFAAGDKGRGSTEEYRAAVMGSNSHFGTYAVDAEARFVTFRLDRASFPNWDGIEQKRPFTVRDGELRYTVPATTDGDGTIGEVVWRRLD